MKATKYNKVYPTRRLVAVGLILFAFLGSAWAQGTDGQFVIRNLNGHYLAHVKVGETWTLQDATTFSPNCLWYSGRYYNLSGTNHNYYFMDDTDTPRFLYAPMQPGASISLSASLPETFLLGNTDGIYYFYNWDYSRTTYDGGGMARGHKWTDITDQTECQNTYHYSWGDNECWEVYWVSFNGSAWKLTEQSSYTIYTPDDPDHTPDPNAGRFRTVQVTAHERVDTPVSGGLTAMTVPTEMEWIDNPHTSANLSASISSYSYTYVQAYTEYTFEGVTHYYYENSDHNGAPGSATGGPTSASTYAWTVTGAGATYLSLTGETTATPTLTYSTENTEGHKTATVTLTVTYADGAKQTMEKEVVVKTRCQSPAQAAAPVCTYDDVTISWYPTAPDYNVYWKKSTEDWPTTPSAAQVGGDATGYIISGLEPNTNYDYKVCAICGDEEKPEKEVYHFKTKESSGVLVYGGVFGGGRMADVSGKTEVVVINCDSITAVFGGNDIAGTVSGAGGSTITLGVDATDPDAVTYNGGKASTKVRVSDVYGGGNGYYIYDGVNPGVAVGTTEFLDGNFSYGASDITGATVCTTSGVIPKITKTAITVTNNAVKVDSIFGGAKNAFITNSDANANGTNVTFKGGTAYAVFGGNNYGGIQTAGKQHVQVNGTKTETTNYNNKELGRDFGIAYVFGGGNKVAGKKTDVLVKGGQCDSVFAGGNAADVAEANVQIDCEIGTGSDVTYGSIYSQAISSYSGGALTIDPGYNWDGTGIYNVRALFGGNNKADMAGLPNVTLTSGSVGTAYGGGNAGNMNCQVNSGTSIGVDFDYPEVMNYPNSSGGKQQQPIYYSTHIVVNSPTMFVDYLYGGCQMSDVLYSTWVEMQNGHVGNVFGGCNISGDVGSIPVIPYNDLPSGEDKASQYQFVKGGTYVKASGGTIYKNLFAGGNGYYHCNDGVSYIPGIINPDDDRYLGLTIPTHNETHVLVTGGNVKGNVYAGGNMAPVGFIEETDQGYTYRDFVGFASVRMSGGTVDGDVYGGGNMASIYGSNEVQISGSSEINGALYGGNDQCGMVAQITNRVLPSSYDRASDDKTSLAGIHTYISLTGTPEINTVFGGGNGDYNYTPSTYCNPNDKPIQSNTFVDINIDNDGHINTVYGGGDGVTVNGGITVFLNVNEPEYADNHDHVGTIFGGNNKGNLEDLVPDIILLNGQVNTVYGGCNEGALGYHQNFTINGTTYENIGSMVRLRSSYDGDNDGTPEEVTARVSGYVYGGCRKNGVFYNSLVLVEGGNHSHVGIFGGSDISGNVRGNSRVVVTGGTVGDIYAGGNGGYDYTGALAGLNPPYCASSRVDLINGTVTGNLFAGGYAGLSGSTQVEMSGGSVAGNVFGGGNEAGTTTAEIVTGVTGTGHSTVNITNGTVGTGIYGGCNASGSIVGNSTVTITGSADNHTAIGDADNDAVIFGGGLGAETSVVGNVTVNFGDLDVDDTKSDYPLLYGELYGGSALGTVNTYDNSNTTTVNVLNGAITGAVFGGGKGLAGNADRGKVNGKVYLNIGSATNASDQSTFKGQATLANCRLFGCNNTNGTPQDEVFVHVYKTAHTAYDVASGDLFAIDSVFGGGNKANYAPLYEGTITPEAGPKSHVYVHGCDNTIQYLFGGGNAADAVGTVTIIEGGHFDEVFGGGNGYFIPANIGTGGAGLNTHGGRYNYVFGGSNMQGTIQGPMYEPTLPSGAIDDCGQAIIDSYFVGTNEAEIYTDLNRTITCAEAGDFKYSYVYGGCRWGIVYGDINLTVQGGTILNVFGGSKGKDIKAADIRRFPSFAELQEDDQLPEGQRKYSQALRDHMGYPGGTEPSYVGHGGNVNITINSGTVGNVYGGCDVNGNVEGQITVIVNKIDCDCGLFVGDVYGGGNKTDYEPDSDIIDSPLVKIEKGTLGGTAVFATGSRTFEGNVFGGGNEADVISNPKVVIGKKSGEVILPVTINGNVYGGGNNGDVKGSPQVIVVPE